MTDAPSSADKALVVISHLSGFLGLPIVLPLIFWLVKKDESSYVAENAREALNFHISLFIYAAISCVLILVLVGFVLLMLLGLLYFVLSIVAAIKSAEGKIYRYPLTLRLF